MIQQTTITRRHTLTHILAASFVLTGLSWCLSPPTQAEVPPRKLEDLKKDADLIIVGKVRNSKRSRSTTQQGIVSRNYYITVNVTETEKGGLADGKTQLIARGYTVTKRPPGNVGASGHYTTEKRQRLSVLRSGSKVRMYLTKRPDGTYDILRPNGFEPLKK